MASKIGIAFHKGGIIPAAVLKRETDTVVRPHEAVEVPADYGQHLINDKFAYAKEVEKAAKSAKKTAPSAADITVAEKALKDAEDAVIAAGDDIAAKADAEQMLADATAALEKLKS